MHVGCTLAFVCWLSCSLSLLSRACWCMTMHTFLFLYVCVSAVKVVCMFGRADIKAGHAHTCAGLYGAAVDLFVESLPLLSSFLLLSFGKWPCHPLLQRTLIYTCLNSTGEREKQNERGTEEKTWTLPNLCELCHLSRLETRSWIVLWPRSCLFPLLSSCLRNERWVPIDTHLNIWNPVQCHNCPWTFLLFAHTLIYSPLSTHKNTPGNIFGDGTKGYLVWRI